MIDVQPPTVPVRILCVDDNSEVLSALQRKLSRTDGFLVVGALADSDHVVEAARDLAPDIVLMDLDMPGRSAFDVTAELVDRNPRVRVVLFTGHVRSDLIARSMDAGAWGYLSKNQADDDLIRSLRRIALGEFVLSPDARQALDADAFMNEPTRRPPHA